MSAYTFRPLGTWPHRDTHPRRSRHTFRASWTDTLDLLDRELAHLAAFRVIVQADFRESDLRLDGLPRADARTPTHPGVILSFESQVGPLRYATDSHAFWQHNIRAIALGLEALRAVDRYGITRTGEQYTGWKQLTAGSGITTHEAAVRVLSIWAQTPAPALRLALHNGAARTIYRTALRRSHPDHDGTTETLAAVRDAGRVLGITE